MANYTTGAQRHNNRQDKIWEAYKKQQAQELPDDKNPKYMFGLTDTDILCKIVNGEINPLEYAKRELANRGMNKDGQWVGFDKAEKLFKLK